MKLGRRPFLKLIPAVAIAVTAKSCWFLEQNSMRPTRFETPLSASTPEANGFPIAWNVQKPPPINAIHYRLKIDGDVPNPLELTLDHSPPCPTSERL
jgi:hypothetical protein